MGITQVTYVFQDPSGNSAVCSFNVEVTTDLMAADGNPCPRRAITIEQQGTLALVEWKTPIIHTTIRGETIELKQESPLGSGRHFPVGATEVIYSADDALCRFWVIIKEIETTNDVTPPTVYDCPEGPLKYVTNKDQISIKPNWKEPFAIDDSGLPVESKSSHSSGDPLEVGTTNVIFNFTDFADNFVQCIFIISVIETEETVLSPDILFCPASIPYYLVVFVDEVSVTWNEPVIENVLNLNQTHFPGDFFKIGTTEVTYTAVNSVGKKAVCSFSVDVRDVIPPKIFLCPSDKSVRACRGSTTVMWLEPSTEDNSRFQVEQTQSHIPGVSLFKEGITTVNYQFEDIFGNAAVCSFNITVHRNSCRYFTQEELNLYIYIALGLLIFIFVILIGVNCYIYKTSGTSSENDGNNLILQDLTTT
ncbi:Hyalin [Holothuria leucospilota]|uniref:Hyalin n=1 Tax=Holothuria leucospilota TaxID=206669 RepID=A0A9Q1C870_HOLLE|nr:Hyalin [Holothuria leucospilota]